MSCKELLDAFYEVGGTLTCNYQTNECKLEGKNEKKEEIRKRCYLHPTEYGDIECILFHKKWTSMNMETPGAQRTEAIFPEVGGREKDADAIQFFLRIHDTGFRIDFQRN